MIWTRSYVEGGRDLCCVEVKVEGVPVTSLIHTGSDITIICCGFITLYSSAGLKSSKVRLDKQKYAPMIQSP